MKKVLLVATVQSHICQFHKPLVELLREYDCTIHVAARDNLVEKNGLKLDFADKVFDVPFSRSPVDVINAKAYKQLKEIIDNGNYDVVHCNTPVGGILTRLAAGNTRKKGTKVYYTAHGFHFYKGAPIKNWLMYYPIEKMFAGKTDKLITIVAEDYEIACNKFRCPAYRIHGVGVDERKFHPITDVEKLELRKKLGLNECQKIILCVGELLENKNQKMILQSMPAILKEDSNVLLLVAGNGPKERDLISLINQLSLQKHVKMLGYVTNIHEYHKASDLLVSCSIREGLPLNVIESMMVGNPVVITDNRGHRELINQGKNGCLVPVNDIEQMIEGIKKMLFSNETYENISNNAIDFAVQYHSETVKKELKGIYEYDK